MVAVLLISIFKIVLSIVSIFITPVVNGVTSLFPNSSIYYDNIVNFFNIAFTYISTILRWFLFTPSMFLALADYFLVKWSIWLIGCIIRFGIRLYNILKP